MDLVGPAADPLPTDVEPLFGAIADEAAEVDRTGVRRGTIDALGRAGLLGIPLTPPSAQRELTERLAMADASTWFCWAQHQTPMRILSGEAAGISEPAGSLLVENYLQGMQTGRLLGAVAFAHVRRPGLPNPSATRVAGGWRFEGTLDWVTSWDIADVVMIMAQGTQADSETLVCAYLPAGHAGPPALGMQVGPTLELLAMSGTHTRPITLSAVEVPDDRVVLIDRSRWMEADQSTTANANPAAFGIARGAIAELAEAAHRRNDEGLRELAEALTDRCREVRAKAYAAADTDASIDERLRLRAASLELAVDAAVSVVTARAGAAMQQGQSAERRVREAMFMQVQAQTSASRSASVSRIRRRIDDASALDQHLLGR
ncbi:MAG: acyl-CoA dehydrogenase family protein [Candidatus Nanopelagicales bacterium]